MKAKCVYNGGIPHIKLNKEYIIKPIPDDKELVYVLDDTNTYSKYESKWFKLIK